MKQATILLLLSLSLLIAFPLSVDAKKKSAFGSGASCTQPSPQDGSCLCDVGVEHYRCENCNDPNSECDLVSTDHDPRVPPGQYPVPVSIVLGSIIISAGIFFGLKAAASKGRG
jgi:hypothetical protein